MRSGPSREITRIVAGGAAVVGLLVVAVVARSTPAHPFVEVARSGDPAGALTRHVAPAPSVASLRSAPAATTYTPQPAFWKTVVVVLAVLLVVAVLAYVVRLRVRLARHAVGGAAGAQGPVVDRIDVPPEQVTDSIDAGFAELERGPARDAIIACWLRVEAAAGAAGAAVHPAETSAEFADRVLGAYGVRAEPLHALAALYREARFSEHDLPESDRALARAHLDAVRDDLGGARAEA